MRAKVFASELESIESTKWHPVMIVANNSSTTLASILGAHLAGVIPFPTYKGLTARELQILSRKAKPTVFFQDEDERRPRWLGRAVTFLNFSPNHSDQFSLRSRQ